MKKITTFLSLLFAVFLLAACEKEIDLSGTYYYVQNLEYDFVHQVTLRKDVSKNKEYQEYIIVEMGNNGITNKGTLIHDGETMTIDLPENSNKLSNYGQENGEYLGGINYDLGKVEGIPFYIEEHGFSLGGKDEQDKLHLYKNDSELGKKYQEVWSGRDTWENVFGN
ncbi:TPA: hypothetical protein U2C70_002025 [Streptococcus suis]|nr:hypothetical protein [Streptococcus suis]